MFLLIDKPSGHTSYDVIRKIKKFYPRGTKIGHSGTLDPFATGLLIIALGKDTKQLHRLQGLNKTYRTLINLSKKTDTRDCDPRKYQREGSRNDTTLTVPSNSDRSTDRTCRDDADGGQRQQIIPSQEELITVLDQMLQKNEFPLTPFSAKKKAGKKFYEYAREGNPIFIDSGMKVLSYTLHSYQFPYVDVSFEVVSGTYIRSLGHWIGEQLGVGGILEELRREKIGGIQVPKGE